jgi:hypothetical protein
MSKPIYKVDQPFHIAHRRKYRRNSSILFTVFLAVCIAIGIFIYSIDRLNDAPFKKSVGATFTQTIAGPQTFRSPYFQFSDTEKWTFAPNDSPANIYTWLLYENGVPAYSLTVYINKTPLQYNLATTYVLPVRIKNDNSFTIGAISQPCGSLYTSADLKHIKMVQLSGTNMLCVPDSPQYTVQVGQIGGDYNLMLKRNNGQVLNYIILYHDLSVDPDPSPLLRIMSSFQAI